MVRDLDLVTFVNLVTVEKKPDFQSRHLIPYSSELEVRGKCVAPEFHGTGKGGLGGYNEGEIVIKSIGSHGIGTEPNRKKTLKFNWLYYCHCVLLIVLSSLSHPHTP